LIFVPLTTKVVCGRNGLVATTTSPIAAHAGVEALRAGGTAADAAAAVALTQPAMALGSYVSYAGIMQALYYDAVADKIHSLTAGWNSYLHEADPKSIPACDRVLPSKQPEPCVAHGRKTLVPGFMAGIDSLHQRFGRLAFSDLFRPAIWYAENGLTVGAILASYFADRENGFLRTVAGRQFLQQAGNDRPQVGDRFIQAQLAGTLRAVAKDGARHMYRGAWGQQFVDAVRREGGMATMEDMERYEVFWEEPLETTFNGHRVVVPALSSSGGIEVLQALNLVEQLQLHRTGPYWQDECAFRDLSRVVTFVQNQAGSEWTEVLRREGVDCSPTARVTKAYAQAVAPLLAEVGCGKRTQGEPRHSDAIVVIDRWGNIASVVHTINTVLWGDTGMVVGGIPLADSAGFLQAQLASLAPGARVPDTMATAIALANGKPILATAAIGSALMPETVRTLLGVLGNKLAPQIVQAAPPLLYGIGNGYVIPDGAYEPEFVSRVEGLGEKVSKISVAQMQRGWVVLGARDSNNGHWHGCETKHVFGFARGEPPIDEGPGLQVTVDPAQFDGLAGHYKSGPRSVLTIAREGNRLFARSTGQPKFELFAKSNIEFFFRSLDAQVTFSTDATGHSTHLVLHQSGREISAPRIDGMEAERIEAPRVVAPLVLERYVGHYRLESKTMISITRNHDRLFARETGRPVFDLIADSEELFYGYTSDGENRIGFAAGDGGKARSLLLHRKGKDERGERIEPSEEAVVLVLDDNQTPMEFVVHVLETVFGKSYDEAASIMLETHHHGRGVCGTYARQDAEELVHQVADLALKHQHPLQCICE